MAKSATKKYKNKERVTVGSVATSALLEGKTTDAVIKAVKSKFPESKITVASVGWYRGKLRSEGKGKKLRQLPRGRKPQGEKQPAKKVKVAGDNKPSKKTDDLGL